MKKHTLVFNSVVEKYTSTDVVDCIKGKLLVIHNTDYSPEIGDMAYSDETNSYYICNNKPALSELDKVHSITPVIFSETETLRVGDKIIHSIVPYSSISKIYTIKELIDNGYIITEELSPIDIKKNNCLKVLAYGNELSPSLKNKIISKEIKELSELYLAVGKIVPADDGNSTEDYVISHNGLDFVTVFDVLHEDKKIEVSKVSELLLLAAKENLFSSDTNKQDISIKIIKQWLTNKV